jgi:amidophosphoribosyltransferase
MAQGTACCGWRGASSALIRIEDKPQEHCGIVGIRSYSGKNVTALTLIAMEAQQHRGQQSFGIAVLGYEPVKMKGLVYQGLLNDPTIEQMVGSSAIGHLRYATAGSESDIGNFHPIQINSTVPLRIAHNGTISAIELRRELEKRKINVSPERTDTELSGYLLAELYKETGNWAETFRQFSSIKVGSFCFVLQLENGDIIAARDERGYKPLSYGYHERSNSYVVASEDVALKHIGARKISDVHPGHMLMLGGQSSPKLYDFMEGLELPRAYDPFEISYFARPDSILYGNVNVAVARKRLGKALYRKYGVLGDLVVPVPESGNLPGEGYSDASGVRLSKALIKDRYNIRDVQRGFIEAEKAREDIAEKMILIPEFVNGMYVVVVDDSIIRGTSSSVYIRMLKDAGAAGIVLLAIFPPPQFPCRMGIAYPSREELIAYRLCEGGDIEGIGRQVAIHLEIDFVGYLNPVEFSEAVGMPLGDLCFSCVTGDYSKLEQPQPLYNLLACGPVAVPK